MQWAAPRGAPERSAGRPSASPSAGPPARKTNTGGWPTRAAPPAGLARPAAGGPGVHPRLTAPDAGSEQDLQQRTQSGFEHRPYGEDDPKGDSWSEKMNVWSTRVIANDQRERRLFWQTAQEGSLWRASLHILPRPALLREAWEVPVTYTGALARTKRDAATPRRTPAASCC